jgi:hypothetical protein
MSTSPLWSQAFYAAPGHLEMTISLITGIYDTDPTRSSFPRHMMWRVVVDMTIYARSAMLELVTDTKDCHDGPTAA